jgi:hypothetical protein
LRQLAIFWLACAATGFVAAAGMALLLSMAIDHRMTWQRPVPVPIASVLERLQPRPHNQVEAGVNPGF